MKLRILFVDDEPRILAGLRRMLRARRDEWETAFAESGAEALEILEREPFDVIVSDMRMPGMDGAELLAEVRRRHPEMLRIVLSGHSEIELVLSSVGPSHQYLTKPCDAETLHSTIVRAAALREILADEKLRSIVSRLEHMPSMPKLFSALVEELGKDDASIPQVAALVIQDPAMTAQVLRLVNSAYFGLPREINSAERAVSYLGIGPLSSLVLREGLFAEADRALIERFHLEEISRHGNDVASLARRLAKDAGAETIEVEDAFTAGLLHDAGKVILATNLPDRYEKALEQRVAGVWSRELEEELVGADHGVVGAYLMSVWGLPSTVVEAIAYHHRPSECRAQGRTTLTWVHVANALVSGRSTPCHVDTDYLRRLDLASKWERWQELAEDLHTVAEDA
ncbi:MAG TPA: HDOD domain-containing protein [Acidobacteria bacterium]|nr:HDOD domain-containing protein [Acidobacteriota bacterium]